jgi:putative transposase
MLREPKVRCFEFIQELAQNFSISALCKVMKVPKSGYFAWKRRPPSKKVKEDQKLSELVQAEHGDSRGTYGHRRIKIALLKKGIRSSANRIGRLMTLRGIRGKSPRKFRITTIPNPKFENGRNLIK